MAIKSLQKELNRVIMKHLNILPFYSAGVFSIHDGTLARLVGHTLVSELTDRFYSIKHNCSYISLHEMKRHSVFRQNH